MAKWQKNYYEYCRLFILLSIVSLASVRAEQITANFDPSLLQETMEDIDKNGDGKIDLQEYIGKCLLYSLGKEGGLH